MSLGGPESLAPFVPASQFGRLSTPATEAARTNEPVSQRASGDRLVLSAAGKEAAAGLQAVFTPSEEQSSGLNPAGTDAEGLSGNSSEFAIERIKERIAELKEKIEKLKEELQELEKQPPSEARDQKIKAKQEQMTVLQSQMTQMNNELNKAMEEAGMNIDPGAAESAGNIARKQALGG